MPGVGQESRSSDKDAKLDLFELKIYRDLLCSSGLVNLRILPHVSSRLFWATWGVIFLLCEPVTSERSSQNHQHLGIVIDLGACCYLVMTHTQLVKLKLGRDSAHPSSLAKVPRSVSQRWAEKGRSHEIERLNYVDVIPCHVFLRSCPETTNSDG